MIGPIITTAAGTPLAQTKGTEMERAGEEVGAQRRRVYHEQEAEAAAGVGEPDGEDHETAERDGDGRRPWEDRPEIKKTGAIDKRQSKDPSHQSGNFLDLTG
jgi:hypothetical protein